MGKYSIKELEQLSGIKAHTIRIWEKRHKIIEPSRTSTNIRFYSDDDLKKIINVSLLNNHGIKISKIADMSVDDVFKKVLQLSESKNDVQVHIDQLVVAMIDLDEAVFERILSNLILRYDFERTILEIVYPFLEKIGVLWQTENITPAHEHFISNLIRQKLIVAIDGLPIPDKSSQKAVLYLPEQEQHEIGLLFYHYLCRKHGYRSFYLGQCVPYGDLLSIAKNHAPQLIVSCLTSSLAMPIEDYLNKLSNDFASCRILLSGYQLRNLNLPELHNVRTFSSPLEFKSLL
ncbi:MAG: MerR family transcriptional regulator [Chryseolinea sp.]